MLDFIYGGPALVKSVLPGVTYLVKFALNIAASLSAVASYDALSAQASRGFKILGSMDPNVFGMDSPNLDSV